MRLAEDFGPDAPVPIRLSPGGKDPLAGAQWLAPPEPTCESKIAGVMEGTSCYDRGAVDAALRSTNNSVDEVLLPAMI